MLYSWRLGRVGAMLVRLHYTWLLVGGVGLWILALAWLPQYLADAPAWARWALAATVLLAYFFCLLLAEGVRTRVAGIFAPGWPRAVQLLPFGAAAAYPMRTFGTGRAAAATVAAPVVLALLGGVFWLLTTLLPEENGGALRGFVSALAAANLGAAALHLIPGLPLAGGWLVTAVPGLAGSGNREGFGAARMIGFVAAVTMALAGAWALLGEGEWPRALGLLALAWAVLEGNILIERRMMTREMLEHMTAGEVMQTAGEPVSPDENLARVMQTAGKAGTDLVLPVAQTDGSFAGLLPVSVADRLLQGTWATTPVRAVMVPAHKLTAVRPETPLPAILFAFSRAPAELPLRPRGGEETTFVPVVVNKQLRGIITNTQISEFERMGTRVGVQEAAALASLSEPSHAVRGWAGALLGLALLVLVLSAAANAAPMGALAGQGSRTPEARGGSITFGEVRPGDGEFVPRGQVDVEVPIESPTDIRNVTITFDGEPVAVSLDPPDGNTATARASVPANLLGSYTLRAEVEAEDGHSDSMSWTITVTSDEAAGEPTAEPTPEPAVPPLAELVGRQPVPGGLVPAGQEAVAVAVTFNGLPESPELLLNGEQIVAELQGDTPAPGMYRLLAAVGPLAAGEYTLGLTWAGGEPVSWEFTALEQDAGNRYFPETGHFLSQPFLAFWEANGGIDLLGLPISDPRQETAGDVTYLAQYFERARLEQHAGGSIHMGLLGVLVYPPDPPAGPLPDAQYFEATGHNLSGAFLDYWQSRGGLVIFGYPISEEIQEVSPADGKTYTVQYFERARFEHHPENAGTNWEVILGQLGRQVLEGGADE